MTIEEAENWMAENLGDVGCEDSFSEGETVSGRFIEMRIERDGWCGEIGITYWENTGEFEIWGWPNGYSGHFMTEVNKTAVIKEVESRIGAFDDYMEEEREDMEANRISDDNREYGSMAVAW